MIEQRTFRNQVYGIYKSYSISMLCFNLVIILSPFVAPYFYPVISGALTLILFSTAKKNRLSKIPQCQLLQFTMGRVLLGYTILLIIINICYRVIGVDPIASVLSKRHMQVPQFPVLLLEPMLIINLLILSFRKANFTYCKMCLLKNGFSTERTFAGKNYNIEVKNLVVRMMFVASFIALGTWGYYIYIYNTANISQYDRLIFIGFPVFIWLFKEVVLGFKFWAFKIYWTRTVTDSVFIKEKSLMRYLVVCKDELFIAKDEEGKYDTPIHNYIPFKEEESLIQAYQNIRTHFKIEPTRIKYMYSFNDLSACCGIYHYLCFVDSKDKVSSSGEWANTDRIKKLYNENKLAQLLRIEMFRIITIILTKKTYNEDGSRIYNIKGYKPAFELADLHKLSVDYSDKKWMLLSVQNEDNKLHKFRRFWYKYVEGTMD